MHKTSLVVCAFVTLASAGLGQSARVLGKDNAAYARILYQKGYTDLAEGVCKAINELEKQGKADRRELLEVQALSLDLRLEATRRETDPLKQKNLISAVITDKLKFVEEHPRSPEGQETRNNLPDAYRILGEALTKALARETDTTAVTKLRAEGDAAFAEAEKGLAERKKTLDAARLNDDDAKAEQQYMGASFNLARTYYYHSRFYPDGDANRTKLLKQCLEAFEEFGLDYGQELLNYEGLIFVGLCHKALGEPEDALVAFDDAILLRGEPNAQGQYDLNPEAEDTLSKAVLQKVLLLSDLKRYPEAIATAENFFATSPGAIDSSSGLPVLAARADAELASDDSKGASATAQKLIDADPQGAWGNKGRDVLGKLINNSGASGGLGSGEILKVAENLLSQQRFDQAIEVCLHAVEAAHGDAKEADNASAAFYLLGQIYARRNWPHEAAVAYDTAYERYPKGKSAPDALWRSINAYQGLFRREQRPIYKRRLDDRMVALPRDYPNHPTAALVQQIEGQNLADKGKFLEAAEIYRRVKAGSSGFEEAQANAGISLYRHADSLVADKKNDAAKPFLVDAEELLKKALVDLSAAQKKTLDTEVLARLSGAEFTARATLCQLYLQESIKKPELVMPLLAGLDEKYAADANRTATIWTLRIKALEQQGKLDEAVQQFDALLLNKQQDATALAGAAGVLARALDQAAVNLLTAKPDAPEADERWRKAASYYAMSVKPQVNKTVELNAANTANMEAVAGRLVVIGMHFNRVPEKLDSFVGWTPESRAAPEYWQQAAAIYEALVEYSPSYRPLIQLGRTYGFLGRWKDAAVVYGRLFDQEALVKKDKTGFNNDIVSNKPELLQAYLEWGVVEDQLGVAEQAPDRLARASDIFDLLSKNTTQGKKLWWQSRYYQIRCLMDRGNYERADIGLGDLTRTTNDLGTEFGFKPLFDAMRAELDKKVFKKK